MNIKLIFGPLAILSIFYTSVQGQIWSVIQAKVGDQVYKNQVTLKREDDGKTWYIHAIPENSNSSVPEVVHGPFELRGFGPYSMLIIKLWLNTTGDEKYVTVNFPNIVLAREFYHVLNPHHSPTFPNDFAIKRLVVYTPEGNPKGTYEDRMPKALDIFLLETDNGQDSRVRSYVVHRMDGNQEPILIFHSLETKMVSKGDSIMLSIRPQNSPKKYLFKIEFEDPSFAQKIHDAYTTLKVLGSNSKHNLHDLEALRRNTFPSLPPYEHGESSNIGQN